MFKAGPTGSLVVEAKAFVYLKQFYEGTATLPYIRCWNKKTKGPQDKTIPMDILENEEEEEWRLVEDNEEEGESNLYTNLEYARNTENEMMDESTMHESFWYHYQRDNKPVEQTLENAITLGDLTMLRKNLGEMHDSTMIQLSQPGSPVTST